MEEVYELVDAIEAGDDGEMLEELGDLLLQVVFHAQMADERGAFDFDDIAQTITDKLIRRHPHVFGGAKVKDVDGVWNQWDAIKQTEKVGTANERKSAFDGIPRHLPALMRAHEVAKKGASTGCWRKAGEAAPNGLWGKNCFGWRKRPRRMAGRLRRCCGRRRSVAKRRCAKRRRLDNAVSGLNLTTEFMSDPRYDKLAKLLVEYSCALKKGESVFVDVADIPDRMTIALVRAARKVGVNPIVETRQSRVVRELVKGTTDSHAKLTRDVELHRMKKYRRTSPFAVRKTPAN